MLFDTVFLAGSLEFSSAWPKVPHKAIPSPVPSFEYLDCPRLDTLQAACDRFVVLDFLWLKKIDGQLEKMHQMH